MGDNVTKTIDGAFDSAERFVDGVGQILGVDTSDVKASKIDAKIVSLPPPRQPIALPPASEPLEASSTPAKSSPRFRILPGIGLDQKPTWLVMSETMGVVCATEQYAKDVLAALEKGTSK